MSLPRPSARKDDDPFRRDVGGCTAREVQLIEASRWISDGDVVAVGAGATFAVAAFAQRTHAPYASFLIDSGIVDPVFDAAPVSVCDPDLRRALRMTSMTDVFFGLLQGGRVDVGLLGAAQVGPAGELNSSYATYADGGRRRLPGAGGATAIAAFVRRVVAIVAHERRRFPARCDFVSSPGFLAADGAPGDGAARPEETVVVTDLCVLRGSTKSGRLRVERLMPGVSFADVAASTEFDLGPAREVEPIALPTAAELRLLRETVDPRGLYVRASRGPSSTSRSDT